MRPALSLLIVAVMALAIPQAIQAQTPAITILTVADAVPPAPGLSGSVDVGSELPAPAAVVSVEIIRDRGGANEVSVKIDELGCVQRFLIKRIAKRILPDPPSLPGGEDDGRRFNLRLRLSR